MTSLATHPALRGLAVQMTQRALAASTLTDEQQAALMDAITPDKNNDVFGDHGHNSVVNDNSGNLDDPIGPAAAASDGPHDTAPFINERLGLIIFLVSTITSILLVLTMILREYYFKKHGVDMCRLFSSQELDAMDRRRRADSNQHDADRALAEQLQRQLNEEEKEAERMVKRQERRKWYDYYLRPFTMTVESKDIFYGHEMEQENNDGDVNAAQSLPAQAAAQLRQQSASDDDDDSEDFKAEPIKVSAGSFDEEDDEEIIGETSKPVAAETVEPEPVMCTQDEEDAHLYLRLPVKTKKSCCENDCGTKTEVLPHRYVDGQCALCIDDYEAGDEVVWSGLECTHAFHKTCIMQWLSKGKKRCPVCRNWFVPGARIEDQKKLHGEEWQRAVAALEEAEDERVVQNAFDLEHGVHDNDNNNTNIETEVNKQQQLEIPEVAPSRTEESELDEVPTTLSSIDDSRLCALQCPSHSLGPRSESEVSELDSPSRSRKNTASSSTHAFDTIEECTPFETHTNHINASKITDDCALLANSMKRSCEAEKADFRNVSYEEV